MGLTTGVALPGHCPGTRWVYVFRVEEDSGVFVGAHGPPTTQRAGLNRYLGPCRCREWSGPGETFDTPHDRGVTLRDL